MEVGVGGTLKKEGIFVYTELICFIVQQKLTQYYRASIVPPNKSINKRSDSEEKE